MPLRLWFVQAQQLSIEMQTLILSLPNRQLQEEWQALSEDAWACIQAVRLLPQEAPTKDAPSSPQLRLPAPSYPAHVHVSLCMLCLLAVCFTALEAHSE
jgi:hypothetical protein